MGKSSGGVKGYKYFTSLVLMLGNRIECLLGVNFDKKGWIKPNSLKSDVIEAGIHKFEYSDLYGENEGGISGEMAFYNGDATQMPNSHYQEYYPLAPAYRHQSYVVLQDFYVGNSPYLKDVMFLPKRTQIRNDGSEQWYRVRDDGAVVCEIAEIQSFIKNIQEEFTLTRHHFSSISNLDGSNHSGLEVTDSIIFDGYEIKTGMGWGTTGNVPSILKSKMSISGEILQKYKSWKFDVKIIYTGSLSHDLIGVQYESGRIDGADYVKIRGLISAELASIKFNMQSIGMDEESLKVALTADITLTLNSSNSADAIDINPIHKAREIITDYTAMNKPESDVNDENFRAAADRIWDEGLGISWAIQEKSCKDALDELAAHIEGGFRINRQTGLYEVILFRDDLLDLENALHFDESNIKHMEFESYYAEDAVNSYNVSYYDRENLKDSTFSIDDTGLIHTVGFVNAEKLDFPYFMNRRNAQIVANWKLKQVSTAAWKGSFTTGRYEARKLNKFDVILLSWQSKQLTQLPVRVLNISLGDGKDNTVTIDFIEVVSYSENMNTAINGDESMSKVLEPQPNNAIVFEAPYYSLVQQNGQAAVNLELENNADAGYLMAAVSKPQNNSMYASVYTDKATEDYAQMQKVGAVDYCPSLMLDQDISFTESAFIVKNANAMSQAKTGTLIFLDDEVLVYQSYDTQTKLLTVKRGARDTVPQPHLKDAVFYFFDDFHFLDAEQYVAGETVQVQVLTTTPSAVQKRDPVDVKKLEMNARAIRPYPPANVKINGLYYPQSTVISSDLVLTWVDRNRVQQTGGAILGYFESGVTRENGVTYSIELLSAGVILHSAQNINVDTHTISSSLLIQNKAHTLKLWSVRDGFESYQIFEHSFFIESASLILSATANKDKVFGSTVSNANINVVVDESLSANMQADGSRIMGKTTPNSTIEIKIED